jgi:hypothetical protein
MRMTSRFTCLLAGLALAVVLCGCSGEAPGPPLAEPHAVHGRIAFADKTPLKGGIIYFTPTEIKENGTIRYETAGLVDLKGNYELGFNGDHSGAPAGEYKVTIMPRDYQELRQSNSNRIPERYREQSTTPLASITVKEGDNVLDFELK